MPWFTDTQILAIPAFSGLSGDQIAQLAADAGEIYRYISANPGVDDSDLRSWGEGMGWDPGRLNLACEAIQQAGKAVHIDGGPLTPPAASPAPGAASLADLAASAGASVPTDALTADELRKVCRRMKLDVPKGATKADMAEAISRNA